MTGLTCLGDATPVQVLIQHTLGETCSEEDPVLSDIQDDASGI
jgi:hypothetical protein